MSESSEDRSRERRGTGPLGDDGEETRRQSPEREEATRRIPEQQAGGEARTRRVERRASVQEEGTGTRVMRVPGEGPVGVSAAGYFEAMEEREERLRDIYGGTDWLASFLGFVFALVGGAVLALIPALVLIPLGFSVDLGNESLGTAAITGLAIVGVMLFLMYFFGGYVAGRLARFDGGLNGVILLVWTVIVGVLLMLASGVFSSFLPAGFVGLMQDTVQGTLLPGFDNLMAQGATGIAILIAAVLVALLGAFVGGRVGGRYHRDIDYTL